MSPTTLVVVESLAAAALAVTCEALNRQRTTYFGQYGLEPALQMALGYLLWQMQKTSPNLVMTFVLFSAFTLTFRVVGTMWSGTAISNGTWVAAGLLYCAVAVRFYWR